MGMMDRAEVVSTPMQYALRYAALGWPVFACRENEKRPIAHGGFHNATTDRTQIVATWQQHQRANIGIPAGGAWWVLDVDPRHGGSESLAALEDRYGELPATLKARTPSGGWHLFFRPDARARNTAAKLGPGLDTRGDGGYVCVEGSVVNGGRYQFEDWDPLTEIAPELASAPAWLMEAAFGTPRQRQNATEAATELTVGEGGRNAFLARQAGRLRRMGYGEPEMRAALMALNLARCAPPLPDEEVLAVVASVGRYPPGQLEVPAPAVPELPSHLAEVLPVEVYEQSAQVPMPDEKDAPPLSDRPQSRVLDLTEMASRPAPQFDWWVPGWLSPHPTLLSGRGGVGKSLLALQLAVGCASGQSIIGAPSRKLRVLYWACEDDRDEIHRRIASICSHYELPMAGLAESLFVDARLGLDNTLIAAEYGRPMWTPAVELLRQQLNDWNIDLLILDNLAHVFSASENDRASVTMFSSGLTGLVERPWCPMLIGHVAKSQGSEYAGSTAWENAVRMRWFLGRTMPDAAEVPDEQPDDAVRVLAKRKSNYSADDVLRLRVQGRVFVPQDIDDDRGGMVGHIREKNARGAVLAGLTRLCEMGIDASESPSANYLPTLLLRYELAHGHQKRDLGRALAQLMSSRQIIRTVVGRKANRMPKYGLRVASEASVAGGEAC